MEKITEAGMNAWLQMYAMDLILSLTQSSMVEYNLLMCGLVKTLFCQPTQKYVIDKVDILTQYYVLQTYMQIKVTMLPSCFFYHILKEC